MRLFVLLLAAVLCWWADLASAQRSQRRTGSGGSRGYYSSFGRSSSGRRWNNGVINNINAPSHKGFTPGHIALSVHYAAAQYNGPYRYREEEHVDTAKMNSESHDEDSEVEQATEYVTDVTETTDPTATMFDVTEASITEGLFMRRLRAPSGPHIVRDSWCRVSESKDCVPAL